MSVYLEFSAWNFFISFLHRKSSMRILFLLLFHYYYTKQTLNKVMTYKRMILLRSEVGWRSENAGKKKHTRDTHAHSAKAPEWMNVGYVKHAFERKTKSHPKIEKNWKTFPLKLLMTFVSLNCLLSHPTRYIFLAQIFYLSLHKTIKWAIAWLGLALVGFWKSRKGWRPVFDSWWIMWAFIKLNIFECSAIHWKSTEMCVCCSLAAELYSRIVKWGLNLIWRQLRN